MRARLAALLFLVPALEAVERRPERERQTPPSGLPRPSRPWQPAQGTAEAGTSTPSPITAVISAPDEPAPSR